MKNYQITINNQEIEVFNRKKFGTSISYAIANLMTLNDTKGSTSKVIDLPASAANKIIFGTPEDFNAAAKISHSEKPNATIYADGTPILRGFAKISAATVNGVITKYQLVIQGDNGDWRARIKGKKAQELDYSDQDHTLNLATVQASETLAAGREYVYDLIDRGKFASSQQGGFPVLNNNNVQLYTIPEGVKVDDRYPAIRVPGLIERIFKAAGYKVESNWLNSSHAQKLTIGFTGKFVHDLDFNVNQKFHATNTSPWPVQVGPANLSASVFNSYLQEDSDPSGNWNIWYYKVPSDGQFKFKVSNIIQPAQYLQSTTGTVYVSIMKQDAATAASNPLSGIVIAQASIPFPSSQTIVLETSLLNLIHGDRIMVQTSLYLNAAAGVFTTVNVGVGSTFECTEVAGNLSMQEGQQVNMTVNLPDCLQTQLLQGIAHPYKLMFATDVEARIVYIEPWEDFFSETVKPENNWTDLLDKTKTYGTKFIGDQRGKIIHYAWKEDSNDKFVAAWNDQNNSLFGSSKEDNLNAFAKSETEMNLNPLFAPTWMDICQEAGFITARIPRMWSDITRPAKSTGFTPRLLVYQGVKNMPGNEKWAETSNSGVTMRNTYPSFEFYNVDAQNEDNLLFDDLDLSSGLFQKQWRNHHKTITEGVLFTGFFNLTDQRISMFDFREPIYLEVNHSGAYFLVNEIRNYKADSRESTEVELIKIFGKTPRILLRKIGNPSASSTVATVPSSPVSIDIVTVVPVDSRGGGNNQSYQSFRYQNNEIFRVEDEQVRIGGGSVFVEINGLFHQVFYEDANGNVQPVTKD